MEVKRLNYDKNLTQVDIAKMMGVRQPQVSNWLCAKRFPNSTNLIKSELLVLLYGLSGYWRVKDRNSYVEYLKSTTYSDFSGLGVRYIEVAPLI